MNEFFVGSFRVDMGRSEIVYQNAIVSMEPRVLQVLLILAKHQGEVVTHQQILDAVWKDVRVAPNTLQRCITQLRKALADNAKKQAIIKTHPKVGYSLLENVSWQAQKAGCSPNNHDSINQASNNHTPNYLTNNQINNKLITHSNVIVTVAVVILILAIILVFTPLSFNNSLPALPLNQLTALTTTDKKEFAASYSPDGRYIAFQRYVGLCENEIWAKDLKQNREYLLTKKSGIYGTPSWSPNGQNLAFSNVTHCSMDEEFQGCKDIRVLSFALAKSEPQEVNLLLPCEQQDYSAATWINNDQVVFVATQDRLQALKKLTISSGTVETIYQGKEVIFDSISYSAAQQKLAITQHGLIQQDLTQQNLEQQSSLVLIDEVSGSQTQVRLNPPGSYRTMVSWNVNWHPSKPKLITAKGNTIFEIDLEGNFTAHPIPTMQAINDPYFHPSGERIIASMGIFDKDSHIIQWQTDAAGLGQYQLTDIHRSILSERHPQFDPSGKRLAFISQKSGTPQVWLTDLNEQGSATSGEPFQLSQLTNNAQISAMVWSYEGKLLITLIDGQLNLLNLDGQLTTLKTEYHVVDIYHTPSQNKVLLEVSTKQSEKVILLDLKSMQSTEIYEGDVRWGQLNENGVLYFTDRRAILYQVVDGQVSPIPNLQELNISSIFQYSQQHLILAGRDNSIWQYDLNNQKKRRLFRIKQTLKRVDQVDLTTNRLLITTAASTTKEIVEFHR